MPRRRVGGAEARAVAHDVLVRVETTNAFADVLLSDRLQGTALRSIDRALATQLVYGTLAWQGRLDHHLRALVHRRLGGLDPSVRVALRLGLYQLLFLDRVPSYAAIDTTVALLPRGGAGGLVNAVLRRADAGRDAFTLPDPHADPIGRLAVEWSHPRWLVEHFARERSHAELAALLAANNAAPRPTIRVNRGHTTPAELAGTLRELEVACHAGRWSPDALVIDRNADRLYTCPAYKAGAFTFQSEASQLVTALLDVGAGARVLDACAAPGNKATHVAERIGDDGLVIATDPRPAGARRVRDGAARLGLERVLAMVNDARAPALAGELDAVLVDAPCSGLGTLRRHPEIRWRRRPADAARLAALQGEILDGVAGLVRPGGVLVYAVCTVGREETTQVVERFVARHPRFRPESAAAGLPESAAALLRDGALVTSPSTHDLDGFFAMRLRAAA